jgi:hypothetical protein
MIRQANVSRGKTTDNEEVIGEGSSVEAEFRGGSRYYKGKITRKRLNGTFDILYDDGEKETGVDKSLIHSLGGGGKADGGMDTDGEEELGEGSKVEAKYRGGSRYYKGKITRKRLNGKYKGGSRHYKGKITRQRLNGTFDILYDDGGSEERVAASLIRSLGRGGRRYDKGDDDEHKEEKYFVGAKVEARCVCSVFVFCFVLV